MNGMKSKILLLISLFFLSIGTALGQTITVKGIVLDEKGEPVIGASVRLKSNPSVGAATGLDGDFTLKAKQGELIIVSYVGYKTQEVAAAPSLTIKLAPDQELLDEVVVVGYSTRSVANTSASVVKVSAKDLQSKPTSNVMDAAQGKVSGLQVLTSSGEPSETSSMKLHGVGSLGASSTPLYIVDGMPVTADMIRGMNQNDIESMQFLKDAAATSIYGARAANGVIYIQTKRGKMQDRATITVRGQYGISTLANKSYYDKLMNTNELFSLWQEYEDAGLLKKGQVNKQREKYGMNDTKWWKYFYQDAPMYQSDISISGGSAKTNYYISAGILDQKGIRAGSQYSKINLRTNLNSTLNDWIKVGINSSVSYDKTRISPQSFAQGETYVSLQTILNQPFYTPYDKDGKEYYDEPIPGLGFYNPKYSMSKDTPIDNLLFLNLSGNLTLTPFENFQIRSQAGMEMRDYSRDRYRRPSWIKLAGNGTRSIQHSRGINFTTNNVAEYKFSIKDDHHFIALLGQEYIDYRYDFFSAFGAGLLDDRLGLLKHTTKEKAVDQEYTSNAFLSFFTQLSYDFDRKYFVDLVVRNDASSRFGANHRNATFWSLGLMWKAKEESFLKNVDWINALDVKASYGTQGNAAIGDYKALATVKKGGQYNGIAGWKLSNPGNPDLTWESQDKLTVGVTADLFDRLHVNVEFYNRVTRDMLMDVPQPYSTGLQLDKMDFASIMENVGAYQNRGVDLTIRGDVLRGKDYGLTAYYNMNYNRDKVLELFQGRDSWILPGYGFGYIVGQPVKFIYPVFKDINPDNGLPRWYLPAVNEDGSINKKVNQKDDSKVTETWNEATLEQNTGVNRYPAFTGGFGLAANWKGLSLQADFAFVVGKYMIANETFFSKNSISFFGMNTEKSSANYWKKKGDNAQYPSLEYQGNGGNATEFDTRLLSNASFMRLKNLTIGYELQESLLRRQNIFTGAKIYATARNLFTLTKFNGIDPEVDSNLSFHTNPNTKQYVIGLELSF